MTHSPQSRPGWLMAKEFIAWLSGDLNSGEILFNRPGALAQMFRDGMVLISPIVFKEYVRATVVEPVWVDPALLFAPNIDRASNRIIQVLIEEFPRGGDEKLTPRQAFAATKIALLKLIGPGRSDLL